MNARYMNDSRESIGVFGCKLPGRRAPVAHNIRFHVVRPRDVVFRLAVGFQEQDMRKFAYFAASAFALAISSNAHATAEKVLHDFHGGKDVMTPQAPLVVDSAGNLYGTSYAGGLYGNGTVFELTHVGGHGWTEQLLYSF